MQIALLELYLLDDLFVYITRYCIALSCLKAKTEERSFIMKDFRSSKSVQHFTTNGNNWEKIPKQ